MPSARPPDAEGLSGVGLCPAAGADEGLTRAGAVLQQDPVSFGEGYGRGSNQRACDGRPGETLQAERRPGRGARR